MNPSHRSASFAFRRRRPGAVLLPAMVALFGAGCATSHRFNVDAVRHPDAANARASYVLVDHTSPALDGELLFARAVRDVRTALSSKGFFEAPAGVAPQFEVEIDFGLEGPVQKKLTHTEPVYAPAPSASRAIGGRGADDGGSAGMPRKIGDRTVTRVVPVYQKFLRLTARAASAPGESQPRRVLWSVVVTNEDESDDLVRYVRLMASAAMDAIDNDTGAVRNVVLTNHDGRVAFVERGL